MNPADCGMVQDRLCASLDHTRLRREPNHYKESGFGRQELNVKSLALLILCVTLVIPSMLPAVQAQTDCYGTSATFIQLRNGYLCLNGSRTRFVGADIPSLLGAGYLPGSSNTPSGPTRLSDAGQHGITLVKVWLDNPCPSTAYQLLQSNPAFFFSSLDKMVSDAKNNKILLNPSLVTTHTGSCWSQWKSLLGGDFMTNSTANTALKNTWIKPIVSHYNTSSQIAYWELAGEPDCLNCGGSSDSLQQVIAWANDMATYIRSVDPNHLISGDWGGFGQLRWTGSSWDYSAIDQKTQFMDFVSVHSYCNDFPLVSCSDGALGAVYASGQSDGTLSGATSYYVNLYTAHAHLLGKAMEFSEYNQNLTSDPTGAWDRELLNFTTSENSDSSEIWAWESSGAGSVYDVSPSNSILAQAMSYWSTIISAGSTQSASDFAVSASSPPGVSTGQSASSTITIAGLNGFTGTVTLSENVPSGLTCAAISPGTVVSSGIATVTCSAGNAGTYTLTITGTSGALIQTATATFTFKAPGGICLSCISPTNWSSIEWLMIIGGFIGVVSSMALLNAKASTELDRIRRRGPTVRPSKKGLDG